MPAGAKIIQRLAQKPELILVCGWVTVWRQNDSDFIWRKLSITECILTITLLESMMMLHCKADKIMQGVRFEDRSVSFRLGPATVFVIAKDTILDFE